MFNLTQPRHKKPRRVLQHNDGAKTTNQNTKTKEMDMYHLSNLNFEPAPASFDQSGTLAVCEVATLPDGRRVILGLPTDTTKEATIAVECELGAWLESSDPADWAGIRSSVGKFHAFLADWAAEARQQHEEQA